MPQNRYRFEIPENLDGIWQVISDVTRLGTCFSFVQQADGDANRARWTVKEPLSSLIRTSHLDAGITQKYVKDRVLFKATGSNLTVEGDIKLKQRGERKTGVELDLNIQGTRLLGNLADPLIAFEIDDEAKNFADKLTKTVAGEVTGRSGD